MSEGTFKDYKPFFQEITDKIRDSQYEAMKSLNKALICLYWDIGKEIYKQQQQKGWGKSIVEVLAQEIKKQNSRHKGIFIEKLMEYEEFLRHLLC